MLAGLEQTSLLLYFWAGWSNIIFSGYSCYINISESTSLSLLFLYSQNLSVPEDLSAFDGLELRLKGDGRRYKLIVRTSSEWDTVGYTASFDTVQDQWQSVSDTMNPWFVGYDK